MKYVTFRQAAIAAQETGGRAQKRIAMPSVEMDRSQVGRCVMMETPMTTMAVPPPALFSLVSPALENFLCATMTPTLLLSTLIRQS